MAQNYVNIGMVTYNRLEFTRRSIQSVIENTGYPYRLTLVDNGSTDGTPGYLQEMKRLGHIHNLELLARNIGVAAASNRAWRREPEAKYYLKLDNDIEIKKKNWLQNMIRVIEAVPVIGVLGYNFEPVGYPAININGAKIRPKDHNLGGACFLIPKRTERLLGYWNEEYGLYGEEDADYGERVKVVGLLNAYMADERMGNHLPAGRAAKINRDAYDAADGTEETLHREYRRFKDDNRRESLGVKGKYRKNVTGYRTFKIPFYVQLSPTTDCENKSSSPKIDKDVQKALMLFHEGQTDAAVPAFREIAQNIHLDVIQNLERSGVETIDTAYNSFGTLLLENRQMEAARHWMQKAIDSSKETFRQAGYYFTMAEIKKQSAAGEGNSRDNDYREDIRKGIEILSRKKMKTPIDNAILGEKRLEIGALSEAKKCFKRVLRSKRATVKQITAAYFHLGAITRELQGTQWKEYFRKGLELQSKKEYKTAVDLYRIASMYKQIGELQTAKQGFLQLSRAQLDEKMQSGLYFHLGEIANAGNEYDEAVEHFSRVLQLNPGHRKAREYLEHLKSQR